MLISIVIPVLNEVESLPALHSELTAVAAANDYQLDIVFVDDGSTDGSWPAIQALASTDPQVRGVRFRRNFGKAAALAAGFRAARGELVFTMDADLQDDPAEIPRFLEQIDAGRDVVSGWKKVRHDPWHKVGPSRIFNWMVGRFTGVKLHDHNCGFKCYRREIFDEVHLYGELHRFVPVLAAARGWKVGEIVINHRRRQHGKSKYGVSRIARGFLDLLTVWFLTGYGNRPQHLLGSAGLLCFVAGFGGLVWLTIYWVLVQTVWINADLPPLHQRPALVFSMGALLIGAQFMLAGFLAELITARHARDAAPYSIAERAGETPPSGSGDAKP